MKVIPRTQLRLNAKLCVVVRATGKLNVEWVDGLVGLKRENNKKYYFPNKLMVLGMSVDRKEIQRWFENI